MKASKTSGATMLSICCCMVACAQSPAPSATLEQQGGDARQAAQPPLPPAAGTLLDLTIRNVLQYPTRLAVGADSKLYVTDAKVGSLFIYDPTLRIIGEIKELEAPLGVAVSAQGAVFIGSRGYQGVLAVGHDGTTLPPFDIGGISMPNDIELDRDGRLYVVDSKADHIKVYNTNNRKLERIIGGSGDGPGQLRFPSALAIAYPSPDNEIEQPLLFVADQGHGHIVEFLLDGTFLRRLGDRVEAFSADWQGRFVRLQSLLVDRQGLVHALDSRLGVIQVFRPTEDALLYHYGHFGLSPGELRLPLDIALGTDGATWVANAGHRRIDQLNPVQPASREE